jgi:molybdenum-dependent DNA-binding transcriptional regulator ModE
MREVRQQAFLEAVAYIGTITAAARSAGIHRDTHYDWLKDPMLLNPNDPRGMTKGMAYEKAFQSAREEFRDKLRHEAIRRGMQGVKVPIMYRGAQVLEAVRDAQGQPVIDEATGEAKMQQIFMTKYSDRLLEALLKANCEEFRKKIEPGREGGSTMQVSVVRFRVPIDDNNVDRDI